ncbi:hypothetical protein DRP05_01375 [Archaeoglobales archaeon]|nr:MAG: hypothetical protein DRP05_01375 [Archaeoglobales archaeon]
MIFCNSSFQWFDPHESLKRCYKALKHGGRIGIQAPAKKDYCPNFITAIEEVRKSEIGEIFAHFKNPWFMLENEKEYIELFERHGFKVTFCKIELVKSKHSPNEVYKIFNSGAIVGYLNPMYYDVEIDEKYVVKFREIVKRSFKEQAEDGFVELIFNRVYLVAVK